MALAANRLFVPWVDLPTRASATGLRAGWRHPRLQQAAAAAFSAVDAASGKVLWQHKLPSMDFGAATVANDVVFTSTYAGTIYAFDTADRQDALDDEGARRHQLVPRRSTATRCSSAPARPGFIKKPQFQLDRLLAPVIDPPTARRFPDETLTIRPVSTLAAVAITALALVRVAAARTEPQAHASATTIHVSGKEFFFKLSTKSISRSPAKVTFVFKNVGHGAARLQHQRQADAA